MSSENSNRQSASVTGSLRYLLSADGLTDLVPTVGGEEAKEHQANYIDKSLDIRNARIVDTNFTLDANGFVFCGHETRVSDFYDEAQIENIYNAEVIDLIKGVTGAARVDVRLTVEGSRVT